MSSTLLDLTKLEQGVRKEIFAESVIEGIHVVLACFPEQFIPTSNHFNGIELQTKNIKILIYPVYESQASLLMHYEINCRKLDENYDQIVFLAEQFTTLENKNKLMPAVFLSKDWAWIDYFNSIQDELYAL